MPVAVAERDRPDEHYKDYKGTIEQETEGRGRQTQEGGRLDQGEQPEVEELNPECPGKEQMNTMIFLMSSLILPHAQGN